MIENCVRYIDSKLRVKNVSFIVVHFKRFFLKKTITKIQSDIWYHGHPPNEEGECCLEN
jgi:hypothetical protein